MIQPINRQFQAGTTLIETLVAVTLVVGFFVSLFEVNGICFRYIKASKNNIAALQGAQDRLEQLRNMTFSDLCTGSTVQSLMAKPANSSEFLSRAPTEVVSLTGYSSISNYLSNTADATKTQLTLSAGAASATINTTDANMATSSFQNNGIIKIKVTYTWTEALGGRSRSEESETIVSSGTKK